MTLEITEIIRPKTSADWRKWLTCYHDKKHEIWLEFYKKHTGKQKFSYQEALDQALCFGWIDGLEKRVDEERYVLRFTPRRSTSAWSENNVKRYHTLLTQHLMTAAGTAAFARKHHVYTNFSNKKGAREWHLAHKMPANPSLKQKLTWHREHQKFCACRPIPKSLTAYLK